MADRYWVGGTAAWDGTAGTKWAATSGGAGGQSIPGPTDDVYFNAASGGVTVTISVANTGARSIRCTGFTGTLAGSAAISVSGTVLLVSGMTVTYTGTLTLLATGTLTTAGKTLSNITVSGGTVTLGSALTLTGTLNVSAGTFTTSATNYSLTALALVSTTTSTRTISLNGSTVSLSSTGTALNFTSSLTFNQGTSTINLTGSGANFIGGSKTFRNVSFTSTSTSLTIIAGANTFNQLSFTAPLSNAKRIALTDSQTTTTLVCAGASAIRRLRLTSNTPGTARTVTAATYTTKSDVDFADITAAGTSAPWSGTRLGDSGGNTNITFPAPKTVYYVSAGSGSYGSANWATSSGGSVSVDNFPLSQDTAIIDNSSMSSGSTLDMSSTLVVGTLSCSSRNTAITLDGDFSIFGSLTLSSSVTVEDSTRHAVITFIPREVIDFTSSGATLRIFIEVLAPGGTVRLQNAISTEPSSSFEPALVIVSGSLNLNGYTLTSSYVEVVSGGVSPNLTFNGGTLVITGNGRCFSTTSSFTTTAGTGTGFITLTSSSDKEFELGGAGAVFNCVINQGGAGPLFLSSDDTTSIFDIQSSYSSVGATSIEFQRSEITSFENFTASGTSGKILTLRSDSTSTRATLSKTSGTVSVSFCRIDDLSATGGATWQAFTTNNNTDGGNNLGWQFVGLSSPFFLLF